MSNSERDPRRRGHVWALSAIVAGVLLAVALGVFYGRTMWLAIGGPQQRLDRLEKTVAQKQRLADAAEAAGQAAEAQRLRSQIPVLRQTAAEARADAARAEAADLGIARVVAELVRFCGEVFLRLLMLVVIPLVITSMICGVSSLGDLRQMGRVGGWTLTYYLATGAAAVILGIVLVQWIEPGTGADDTFAYVDEQFLTGQSGSVLGTLLEVVRGRPDDPGSGMIPANIFRAAAETNVLALILFSLLIGGALSMLGERGRPAVAFFQAANDAVMKIVRGVILLTPVGVFGLVADQIVRSGGAQAFWGELARLGWFVLTVSLGLAIHFGVLCAVLAVLARRNPLEYVYSLARALLTALSTDSSSATLPVTMQCTAEAGVSQRASDFVLPLGATINMDGTALYEAVAAIFIAQSAGIPLSGAALVIVFLTATLAAIGAPGIPNAGLVTLLIVLAAVNLPPAGIGTILAIDWLLDRERTTVNVFGDTVGAAVIDRYLLRAELPAAGAPRLASVGEE
jgi:Na+/H+-dicarboxylate symporter